MVDLGIIQLSILLHSEPSHLIDMIANSLYPLKHKSAQWVKSFQLLMKINLYDEELIQ